MASEDVRLTYSHRSIKNTFICGTTFPENLLKADQRTQDSNRERKSSQNWIGQKKEKNRTEKRSNWVRTHALHPWEGAGKGGKTKLCTQRNPLHTSEETSSEKGLWSIGGEHRNHTNAVEMEMVLYK